MSVLTDVLTGKMRLEQAVDYALADPELSGSLLRRMEANRRTLQFILRENKRDFRAALRRRTAGARGTQELGRQRVGGRPLRRQLTLRRRRTARLVNEIGLRMQRLQASHQNLREIGKQMLNLASHLGAGKEGRTKEGRASAGAAPARTRRFRWNSCGPTFSGCGG